MSRSSLDVVPSNNGRFKRPSERKAYYGHAGKGKKPVFLYVAYCKGHAKIGITEHPRNRIHSMQGGCPFLIELLTTYPLCQKDAIEAEQKTLRLLDPLHSLSDWFKCTKKHALFQADKAVSGYQLLSLTEYQKQDAMMNGRRRIGRSVPVQTPDGIFQSSVAAALHYGIDLRKVRKYIADSESGRDLIRQAVN